MTNIKQWKAGRASSYVLALLVIALVIALKLLAEHSFQLQLPAKIQDFVTLSLSVFIEAFPFLVLGSLLAAVVTTYVPPSFFHDRLPKQPLLKRLTLSMLGFMFPVCECGNVPLSRSLLVQGLRPSEAITFLLAAPVFNPITIWSTWTAFSTDRTIVVARIVASLMIANFVGLLLSARKPESEFITDEFAAVCESRASSAHRGDSSATARFAQFSNAFVHEAMIMMKMLAFGALIAGAVQSFVPRDVLVGIGSNVVLSVLAMLLLAFVVSICATVDAFFALSFSATFTAGSLVSFLVFGPMIDIKILSLLKTTFTTELLVTVTITVLLLSALTGLVVTYAF